MASLSPSASSMSSVDVAGNVAAVRRVAGALHDAWGEGGFGPDMTEVAEVSSVPSVHCRFLSFAASVSRSTTPFGHSVTMTPGSSSGSYTQRLPCSKQISGLSSTSGASYRRGGAAADPTGLQGDPFAVPRIVPESPQGLAVLGAVCYCLGHDHGLEGADPVSVDPGSPGGGPSRSRRCRPG